VKKALKQRLLGTRWFPAPPPRRPPHTAAPAPAAKAPRNRILDIVLPPRPGTTGAPGTTDSPGPLHIDVPPYMYIPRVLDEKGLAGYEPFALEAFLTLVEQAPPGAVFDVGANVGLYGLLAAAYSDRPVHAFEPAPDTAGAARAIAAASGLDLTVNEMALGTEVGTATLYLSDSTDSSNSLNPDFRAHSREIVVPLETVDEYVARTGVVPSLLKIDTETTEHEVVAGAEKLIREHRPWILAEVLYNLSEASLHEVMDPHGYTIYHLNGAGPREPVERMVGDKTWTYYMFMFAPEPVDAAFWDRMGAWRTALDSTKAQETQVVAG
jgi:FkbM family methyltransferase